MVSETITVDLKNGSGVDSEGDKQKNQFYRNFSNTNSKDESIYVSEFIPEDKLNALNDIYNQNLQHLQSFLQKVNEKNEESIKTEQDEADQENGSQAKYVSKNKSARTLSENHYSSIEKTHPNPKRSLREHRLSINMNRVNNFQKVF